MLEFLLQVMTPYLADPSMRKVIGEYLEIPVTLFHFEIILGTVKVPNLEH